MKAKKKRKSNIKKNKKDGDVTAQDIRKVGALTKRVLKNWERDIAEIRSTLYNDGCADLDD